MAWGRLPEAQTLHGTWTVSSQGGCIPTPELLWCQGVRDFPQGPQACCPWTHWGNPLHPPPPAGLTEYPPSTTRNPDGAWLSPCSSR